MIDVERLSALKPVIFSRLEEFRRVPEDRWARELLFCILTPQSSALNAERCVVKLETAGVLESIPLEEITSILRNSEHYIRFHNTKATRIVTFVKTLPSVLALLKEGLSPREEREEIRKLVEGYGLKEASHALRNIGRRDLAILDRHILKHLVMEGVISEVPKSLNDKVYYDIERRFQDFAQEYGEPLDVLDLYFWASETGTVFK